MKVLMVGASYPPEGRGGTEVHMAALARGLRSRGHEVAVFCRTDRPEEDEYARARDEVEGIPVHRVNHLFRDTRDLSGIVENAAIDRAFLDAVAAESPDLVHVHHLTGLSTAILDRARERGLPLVMTLHDSWMACLRGQRITPELERCEVLDRGRCAACLDRLWPGFRVSKEALLAVDAAIRRRLRGADLLLAPSASHRERMLELGLDAARVRVVPHGLDHAHVPEGGPRPFPPRRIGYIGSVIPSKGVHVLIEALNLLGRPDLEGHVFGEEPVFHGDKGYGARLRAAVRPGVSVRFHGAYDQGGLPRVLAGIDLLVVPSLWHEAFCLTIREAMLAGIPVLASDLGAMHEALEDLGEDLLFRPGDAQDLAWKIDALLGDEARYRRLERLRGRVRTLEAMTDETLALYREAAGDPDRRRRHVEELRRRKRRGGGRPFATVFFPTWNGGPLFERVLDRVLAQETDFDFEVLCIDSGSRDGTVDAIRRRKDVRLIEIPNAEFNHGLTRNRGIREAAGEVVVLLTQDAEPVDTRWLQRMADHFDDPEVAGVYCHQIPREGCNPFQRDRLRGWTRGEGRPERKRLRDSGLWETLAPFDRYRLVAFDNVASAVRKSVMEQVPFTKRQFGEDVTWGKAAILAGHTLVMDPGNAVVHSHENPVFYEFKRVYLDHQNLHDLVGLRTVPTLWNVAKCSLHATLHLLGAVWRDDRGVPYRLWWSLKTPLYAFLQNLAQYLGPLSLARTREGRWERFDRMMRGGV